MKRRASPYDLQAVVGSEHEPGRYWEIKRHRDTGAISCNCPSWIFCKGSPKSCKHTIAFMAGAGKPAPIAIAEAMLHAVEKRRASKTQTATALTATITHPIALDQPTRCIILPDD
jgi:hypothetical protein